MSGNETASANILKLLQNYEKEGKQFAPRFDVDVTAKLKQMGKKQVQAMIKGFSKNRCTQKLADYYWLVWVQTLKTDWDEQPAPSLTKKRIVTEKVAYNRKPSPLVAGSSSNVNDCEEVIPDNNFSKKRPEDKRKVLLKRRYKKGKNSGKWFRFILTKTVTEEVAIEFEKAHKLNLINVEGNII